MDTSGACAGVRTQLGVYLTGSVAPADRAAIVGHLATCADCRQELADLAGLPALLRRRAALAAAQPPEDVLPEADDDGAEPEAGEALLGRALGRVARRRRRSRWLLGAAALVLVAAAGVGWTQRLWAPSPAEPPVSSGTVLETDRIGGVTVLTDAEGYTLYWFGPDTAARSACDAACIQRWPPVTGPAVAGIGVTGTLGAIVRPDGSLQATYDGHPLYTASVDTAPGQARGNGIWAAGGVWREVTVASRGAPASGTTPSREPAPTPPNAPAESYEY